VLSICGKIIEARLTGGNQHDITVADDITADIVGCHVIEDMGYDSDAHRDKLRANNNIPVIPGRKNRKTPCVYDKALYKLRNLIERFFGKLKENRRLAMRFDKRDDAFMAFVAIATIKPYLC
jgi:transposase